MSVQSLDLASYIAALPADVKAEVFSSPWTSQALFRALSPLAQQYILRLLYVDDAIPQGEAPAAGLAPAAAGCAVLPLPPPRCCPWPDQPACPAARCCCACCRVFAAVGAAGSGKDARARAEAAGRAVAAGVGQARVSDVGGRG